MRAFVAVLVGAVLLPRAAGASPYETFVDIADQAELDDLLASGDISQDTYDEVLDLLSRGVDLNTADRAELYTLPNLTYDDVDKIIEFRNLNQGVIRNPADLVAAGVITEDKLLAISAFLLVSEDRKDPLAAHGWMRVQTRASTGVPLPFVEHQKGDYTVPPFMLRARLTALRHMQAGLALTTTRLQLGDAVYDPNRDALVAEGHKLRVHAPKAYVRWDTDELSAIGGSFRAGFAQRLVFDNSSQYTPNGLYADDQMYFVTDLALDCRETSGELSTSPCEGPAGDRYVTPDFAWRQGLFGVGAGLKKVPLGTGWAQVYGWASASRRSVYQYELVDRGKCEDPHDDSPECSAPTVYVKPEGDPLTPTSRFTFSTLPNVFLEKLVGGNVTYFADRRNSVGATVYYAQEQNLIDGIDLDTQEWSRLPTGRAFGAAGANFSFGRKWLDVFGEAAYSFDKSPATPATSEGGGPAGILRLTATRKKEELEAVFRYYSTDYANPYARPISQPDEFEGLRARDELGVRLRYLRSSKLFQLRALADVWIPPSTFETDPKINPLGRTQPKLDTYVRTDMRTSQELRVGLWLRYQDRDLARGGHDQCYEVSTETSETGEPVPCGGRQLTTIGRIRYQPERNLVFTGMVQHQLLDDKALSPDNFRHDLALWLISQWAPRPGIRTRARVRLLDEAIEGLSDNAYMERSIAGLVDATFRVRKRDSFRVRMDVKAWLDERNSTKDRSPNPELQLWLSYEARL
ncbi:MAG TPA: hypothetical protein VM513_02595 [Kofleriaceae bacterium]|nr:hypothetical protein [Kofleriaceae bacterium]